ncbi:hypothetical protein [Candidatus Magnetaquicoccus inordinatus]|uniref:hypothetical protein n=1 Tax=Candidatus Magnetaquicoccus inordinatus TaxID=2496818 RepID=UPI00102B8499|nr:hypothetical protein [Candidatus Magnetaquicoccus inordinatus]
MAITTAVARVISKMAEQQFFTGRKLTMIELGATEVSWNMPGLPFVIDRDVVTQLYNNFGIKDAEQHIASDRMSGSLFKRFGFEYRCIDMTNLPFEMLKWDLNIIECPPEHLGRYLLTTNLGTSEHVFNQYNVFRLIHDLTSVGGYIVNSLPSNGWLDHSFFNYSPVFFKKLASANGYALNFIGLVVFEYQGNKLLTSLSALPPRKEDYPPWFSTCAVFTKKNNDEFKMPYDVF